MLEERWDSRDKELEQYHAASQEETGFGSCAHLANMEALGAAEDLSSW